MEDNKTQPKEECGEGSSEEIGKPLLSQREIRSIAKDFAIAYVEGRIKISLPTAEYLVDLAQRKGEKSDYKTAFDQEIAIKTKFDNQIHICLGTKKATPDELQQTVCSLFDSILSLRNGDRIEGAFAQYNLETRIKNIEEGLNKVNNLVKEIVEWVTGLPPDKGASNNKSMP